jgi:biopolymer transport protein ExbD
MGHGDASDEAITSINITPLVDVVLVLLVVLMVTASYVVSRSLPIEIPSAAIHAATPARALRIELAADGRRSVDGAVSATDAALVASIRAYLASSDDPHASVVADRSVDHGDVVHVLDLLRAQGVTHVGIAVRPADPDD